MEIPLSAPAPGRKLRPRKLVGSRRRDHEGDRASAGGVYGTAGRLIEVRIDGLAVSRYAYDQNGNRTGRVTPQSTVEGVYDDQDRLLRYGTIVYAYNGDGELLSQIENGDGTDYGYDPLGNLTSVSPASGPAIEYVYDGLGRRIGKKVAGQLVQGFLYRDQLEPVAELDGEGRVRARFVYGNHDRVPDYMIRGGTTYRILSDQLGSPRLVVHTATGQVMQRLDYDEFGKDLLDTNPGFQPFGFAGGLWDAQAGLVLFGRRDYDPVAGRWTTKDPLAFAGGDVNLYVYVLNDPVNLVDPSGTDWRETAVDISAGIGDSLLFGYGDELRDWTDKTFGWNGSANVNRCSDSYRYSSIATSTAVLLAGTGRLAYAGSAKAISYLSRSAEEAIRNRNSLKILFRLGLDEVSRIYSVEEKLREYKTVEAAIRAAGRTNRAWNSAGAAATAGALNTLFNLPECGCN